MLGLQWIATARERGYLRGWQGYCGRKNDNSGWEIVVTLHQGKDRKVPRAFPPPPGCSIVWSALTLANNLCGCDEESRVFTGLSMRAEENLNYDSSFMANEGGHI